MYQRITIDRIEILVETKSIQIRQIVELVDETGNVLGYPKEGMYHRYVLEPGCNLAGQDERVVAIAQVFWNI